VQGSGVNVSMNMPNVHKALSNAKVYLNGTYHGISAKHLTRHLRERTYRFNRRGIITYRNVLVASCCRSGDDHVAEGLLA
jgi:hypothetical protein